MTKERLEFIEKEGTIHHIDDGVRYANGTSYVPISQLIDKEHYEWHQKTYAERTERFEPPMWEDLPYGWWTFDFIAKEGDFINHYVFRISKLVSISIVNETDTQKIFTSDPTKENYEKACEIVRDLFKGESNGKNS